MSSKTLTSSGKYVVAQLTSLPVSSFAPAAVLAAPRLQMNQVGVIIGGFVVTTVVVAVCFHSVLVVLKVCTLARQGQLERERERERERIYYIY